MANTDITAATTYENIWYEYPEPRYWHDLVVTPKSRPFYSFTRSVRQPTAPPVVRSQAQIREEERRRAREASWREMQLHYLHACGVRPVREQDVQVRGTVDGEQQATIYTSIVAKYRQVCRGVAGFLAKSKDFVKNDIQETFILAFVWLYHLVLSAAVIGVLVLLVLVIVQRVFGSMKENEDLLEYVLVQEYRSWAIPQRERLPIDAP
jgi:hypothetical protein